MGRRGGGGLWWQCVSTNVRVIVRLHDCLHISQPAKRMCSVIACIFHNRLSECVPSLSAYFTNG